MHICRTAALGGHVERCQDCAHTRIAYNLCRNRHPAKVVQEWLGHASIVMTLDQYGHLFPRGDDTAELAAAEKALLGSV
jgi:integrase